MLSRIPSFLSLLSSASLIVLTVVSPAFVVHAAGTTEDGLAFLAANKEKEGVIELPSGLQYKVLKKGSGAYHPGPGSPCLCHYKGTLIDGTQFDSSYDRGSPTTFAPNQVIKGWTEAMQLMVEGDKWEMYIPSELGYGDHGSPPNIPGGAVLVFQMELIEINGDDKVEALTCSIDNPTETCNDKEQAYITKLNAKGAASVVQQLERLTKMTGEKMKPELSAWVARRIFILNQMKAASDGGGSGDAEL